MWIYFNVEDEQKRCLPYVQKRTGSTVQLSLNSPNFDCNAKKLLGEVAECAGGEYMVFMYNGKAYEIGSVYDQPDRLELNLIDWGSVDESRFSLRDIMNWEAHSRDPRYFPKPSDQAVNARAIEGELRRKFPNQFDDVKLDNSHGKWTVRFTAELPAEQREIHGQRRVAAVIP